MPSMAYTGCGETPAIVAQRMSELILCFPAAASEGVQWQTLANKYRERYSSPLNLQLLGFSSALLAAHTLLWDVLRIVDGSDTDNPVLAIEDSVAMTPTAGAPAVWPSLYKSLCDIVSQFGTREQEGGNSILVSQLKPHLQRHWHCGFDEVSLSYLTEEGTPVRVKKMKHLLQALLRWREQRVAWKTHARNGKSSIDAMLETELELVPSKKHNDLLLRCASPCGTIPTLHVSAVHEPYNVEDMQSTANNDLSDSLDTQSNMSESSDLMQEIAMLRAENEQLRSKNSLLLEQQCQEETMQKALVEAEMLADVFDNPSEPPPFTYCNFAMSPSGSTGVPSELGFGSGSITPMSPGSHSVSGTATPAESSAAGQIGQVCAMVPMFFMMGDRLSIPSGVVQQARAIFECHKDLPSQLLRPAMSCTGEVRIC